MNIERGGEGWSVPPAEDHEGQDASLSQIAYNIIERMMIRGEIAPGALLSEISLSQTIGIGRTPVREALQRFARDRLVTVVRRKGAVVSDIDAAEYLSILEMRRLVEREIVDIVARTACRSQREALRELARELRHAVTEGNIAQAIEIDRRFKLVEFEVCDNSLLTSAVHPLHALSRRFYFAQAQKPVPQVALSQAVLMERIARGDVQGARAASDAFIDAIRKFGLRVSRRAHRPDAAEDGKVHTQDHDREQSLSAKAYRLIENRIITGQYASNELLSEGRLGQELGLGRTPVREALQRLASHHLITVLPRRGLLVTDFDNYDLGLLVEARRPLESLLSRKAAKLANLRQREELSAMIEPWLAAAMRGDNDAVMDLDLRMKTLVVRAASDVYLADAIRPIHSLARAFYFRHQTVADVDVARTQIEVLRAIVAGDEEEAGLSSLRFIAESAHAIRRNVAARRRSSVTP